MEFIRDYYGIILVVLGAIVYGVTHREIAINYAKKIALQFIFLAEKKSRELLLTEGKIKKEWVLLHGYDKLPKSVRLFISKEAFDKIIQEVFDKALKYIENDEKSQ